MELARLVLDNNEFEFEGESYIQKEGTARGSKLGENYACTYMGERGRHKGGGGGGKETKVLEKVCG